MMKQKAKELKTAKQLLGLLETNKINPQFDSDSSQNESVKLSDTDVGDFEIADLEMLKLLKSDLEDEDLDLNVPSPENINIGDLLLIKFEKKKSVVVVI